MSNLKKLNRIITNKGGPGSGNWGHEGQAGAWGGSTDAGGAEDHPAQLRGSFNKEGEFDKEKHEQYIKDMDEDEREEYQTKIDEYMEAGLHERGQKEPEGERGEGPLSGYRRTAEGRMVADGILTEADRRDRREFSVRIEESLVETHEPQYADAPPLFEVDDPELFHDAVSTAKEKMQEKPKDEDFSAFVDAGEIGDFEDRRMFLHAGGEAGFCVSEDGNITNVFKNPALTERKGVADEMLLQAIDKGGNRLDNFDGYLTKLYERYGFEPQGKLEFDDDMAPENWNYERDGRPDVMFSSHNGDDVETVKHNSVRGNYDFDIDAVEYVDDYMEVIELQEKGVQEALKAFLDDLQKLNKLIIQKGGPGSGNWGHEGKAGSHGGSDDKGFDIEDYPEDFDDIPKADRMKQATYRDIQGQKSKNLAETRTKEPEFQEVEGKVSEDNIRTMMDNARAEITANTGYLAGDTTDLLHQHANDMEDRLFDAVDEFSDVDAVHMNDLMIDNMQKLIYQEKESNRQQFSDHGIRHIVKNEQMQQDFIDVMEAEGIEISGREKLLASFAMINHDVGYTVPLVREGGIRGIEASGEHPEYSEKIAEEQREIWDEGNIFTEEEYDRATYLIRNHDSTNLETDDPLELATSMADNLALFQDEKLPSMFKYVESGKDELVNMGLAMHADDDELYESSRESLLGKIKESDLGANLQRDLEAAVGEITKLTPKFVLGTMAGEVTSIGPGENSMFEVDIQFSEFDHFLQEHFDMGQAQVDKLLSDYDIDERHLSNYQLGEKDGKPILELSVEGVGGAEKRLNEKYNKAREKHGLKPQNKVVKFFKDLIGKKGGAGSGNWGHEGHPGEWGGSAEGGGGTAAEQYGEFDTDMNEDEYEISYVETMNFFDGALESREDQKDVVVTKLTEKLEGNEQIEELAYWDMDKEHLSRNVKRKIVSAKLNEDITSEESDEFRNRMFQAIEDRDLEEIKNVIEDIPLTRDEVKSAEDIIYNSRYDAVNQMVGQWAGTSGDSDPDAIAMQMAAASEFQLGDSSFSHFSEDDLEEAREASEKRQDAYKAFLRAQYEDTQDLLDEHGIEDVYLFRGMSFGEKGLEGLIGKEEMEEVDPDRVNMTNTEVSQQPLTSYSSSLFMADRFATLWGRGDVRTTLAAKVPKERILSTPRTGLGCLPEREFVVLGGGDDPVLAKHGSPKQMEIERNRFYYKEAKEKSLKFLNKIIARIKGGTGSGNWGHEGLPGIWGGGSDGGGSEEFLAIDPDIRNVFDPETAEFSPERFLDYTEDMSDDEYEEFIEKIESEEPGEMKGITYSPAELEIMSADLIELTEPWDEEELENIVIAEKLVDKWLADDESFHKLSFERRRSIVTDSLINNDVDEGIALSIRGSDIDSAREIAEEAGIEDEFNEAIKAADTEMAKSLIDSWDCTSADHSWTSVAIQMVAAEEFGLDQDETMGHIDSDTINQAYEQYEEDWDALKSFINAQYNETQEILEKEGIEDMVVYRGMGWDEAPAEFKEEMSFDETTVDDVSIRMQPMNSFSVSPQVAKNFANFTNDSVVVAMQVPRENILSIPQSGMGTQLENEILVKGGRVQAEAVSKSGEGYDFLHRQVDVYNSFGKGEEMDWLQL